MPSQDIPCHIYRIPTYMKSYTSTRIDIKSSLVNLVINYFCHLITSFHLLLSTSYVPTTWHRW